MSDKSKSIEFLPESQRLLTLLTEHYEMTPDQLSVLALNILVKSMHEGATKIQLQDMRGKAVSEIELPVNQQ